MLPLLVLGVGGTAVAASPLPIHISPSNLPFGHQPAGVTGAAQFITVTNTGTELLTILSVETTGAHRFDFSSGLNLDPLAPGESKMISVAFTAMGLGERSADLIITTGSLGSFGVPLSGFGTVGIPTNAAMFVSVTDSTPDQSDQVAVSVGQCVWLALWVKFRTGPFFDVSGNPNTTYFTDPPRGRFPFQFLWCPNPEDANKKITIYGRHFSPMSGLTITDTVIVHVLRNDGRQ